MNKRQKAVARRVVELHHGQTVQFIVTQINKSLKKRKLGARCTASDVNQMIKGQVEGEDDCWFTDDLCQHIASSTTFAAIIESNVSLLN